MQRGSTKSVGIVLAGGQSRRFGSAKGLAEVGGQPIVGRVLDVLRSVLPATAVIANEPAGYLVFRAPVIPDYRPGRGPLAGLQVGLRWARDQGAPGICCAPCDAPFLEAKLVRELLSTSGDREAVFPESRGPLGYEPLFGWYSVDLLERVDEFVASSERSLHAFVDSLSDVYRLPLNQVQQIADPDVLFLNVNTRDDLARANRLVEERHDAKS